MTRSSPFLEKSLSTTPDTLAIVSLSRNNFQPLRLEQSTSAVDGYVHGATLNTRFGSFPHSTLLGIPWGSQVRASVVDTGSRARKRRLEEIESDSNTPTPAPSQDEGDEKVAQRVVAKAVAASSGFVYILRPTPELWTSSLPHRTQVVYTPDYSYILQRIRARPGTRIIEAGAGSGSFTHASTRAVYNGYPNGDGERKGKVFSFEFHEPRFQKLRQEIKDHSLDGVVQITHRDVCEDGFLIDGQSPEATAVFLDLPAPWDAIHHLSRRKIRKGGAEDDADPSWKSPLDPAQTVHICTFSPCIEQVSRTVTEMRTLGWTDIDMVEIAHRKINVMRDRVGVSFPMERGVCATPSDVKEALKKLKSDLKKTHEFHRAQQSGPSSESLDNKMEVDADSATDGSSRPPPDGETSNADEEDQDQEPVFMQGRLTHRTEQDLKTHTSYLVFAVLPREWDAEAEEAAMAKWPCGNETKTIGNLDKQVRKQQKRELLASRKRKKRADDTQAPAENP
ncbi:hypothetical protein RJ55_00982 [Drechmeria coniospora]|nr:hypothetical protein RJ55_00982 [Drechmeria coniospora]